MPPSPEKTAPKWHHPMEVMKLHKLKQKKKALQARMKGNVPTRTSSSSNETSFSEVFSAKKRKNPFVKESGSKISKTEPCVLDESTDQTLFKLLHQDVPNSPDLSLTSFNNILSKIDGSEKKEMVEIVKAQGQSWMPIDWTLKHKVRILSPKPLPWSLPLRISEEASGITAFTRCLDNNTETKLDISPNAKLHQCSLFWQQPYLPWLNLFPRGITKAQLSGNNYPLNNAIKESLQTAWCDSLCSLYHLYRTKQCPYFYMCANNFTVLFRAGGMCGFNNEHVIVTPTTRGFRQMLKQSEIEFTMPLKKKRVSDLGYETDSTVNEQDETEILEDEEATDEHWLKSMGINAEYIKQINFTQEKIIHKAECDVDNSEQSLVLVPASCVQALFNFLLNCKSATALTGPLAGIPPTLLAPVAFHGATLNSLKVCYGKINTDGEKYFFADLTGPILPTMAHNFFAVTPPENDVTMTFGCVASTAPFSKVDYSMEVKTENKHNSVFQMENLSDCGLSPKILKHFCASDTKYVTNFDCLKYSSADKSFTWS